MKSFSFNEYSKYEIKYVSSKILISAMYLFVVGMANTLNNASWTTPTKPTPMHTSVVTPTLSEREQLKIEFYKTYDVMTGIRIAGTLAGFFIFMVLLVIYKSRLV